MRIFQFRTKSDEKLEKAINAKPSEIIEKTVDTMLEKTRGVAYACWVENHIKHLQYCILDILRYEKMTDAELLKELQYKKWGEISKFERRYLMQRYNLYDEELELYSPYGEPDKSREVKKDYCIGEIFEKYNILQVKQDITKLFDRFSESELIETFEAIINAINARKAANEQ